MKPPRVVTADPADLGYVEWLLREEGLPHEDVREGTNHPPGGGKSETREPVEESDAQFYLALVDGEPVGAGGLEFAGDVALLRSVVVEPDERGEGYGRALVEELLDRAAEEATTAYLLTTTAEEFFDGLDFEHVDRDRVPSDVRSTAYFSERCPSGATCMKRDLSRW